VFYLGFGQRKYRHGCPLVSLIGCLPVSTELSIYDFRFHLQTQSAVVHAAVQQGQCDSGWVWEYVSAGGIEDRVRDRARE